MTVIRDHSYDAIEQTLAADPIVIGMAAGVANMPRQDLAHEDGTPRFEFMQAANREYDNRGGRKDLPAHIGAVARAVIIVLDGAPSGVWGTVNGEHRELTNKEYADEMTRITAANRACGENWGNK